MNDKQILKLIYDDALLEYLGNLFEYLEIRNMAISYFKI